VLNPDPEVRSCRKIWKAFILPLAPPSKKLKVSHPALFYLAIATTKATKTTTKTTKT
jgi:hypothetical protein